MDVLHKIRAYHAVLAILATLAYATGELEIVHAWLGYGVSLAIVFRLLLVLSGERQLGLMRYYPKFRGLKLGNLATHPAISRTLLLGIAACLIGVTLTGITMDRGHAIGLSGSTVASVAGASAAMADDGKRDRQGRDGGKREKDEGVLGEIHETLANLLLTLVILHIAYLLLFKWPLARFMLFLQKPDA